MSTIIARGSISRVVNPSKLHLQAWLADINDEEPTFGFSINDLEAGWRVVADGGKDNRLKVSYHPNEIEFFWLLDPSITDLSLEIFFRVDGFDTPLRLTVTKEYALEILWYICQHGKPPDDAQWSSEMLG